MASHGTKNPIKNGKKDIARRYGGMAVMTEAVGRVPLQTHHLWASSKGKATAKPYNPMADGPTVAKCPILPNKLELIPDGDRTKEYIEVGLVFGEDPRRGMSSTAGRVKASASKQEIKPLERGEHMMRVFLARTEFIERNIKYYVGCRPEGGRLWPRIVSLDTIFFYPEFWRDIAANDSLKLRRLKLSEACKRHAAFNKGPPPKQVEEASPDLKFAPLNPIVGAHNFMNFSKAFTEESAKTFRTGLMITVPGFKPDVKLLMATHEILQRPMTGPSPLLKSRLHQTPSNINHAAASNSQAPVSQDEETDGFRLGDLLQWSGLAFFIEACHLSIENNPGAAIVKPQTGSTNGPEFPGIRYDRDIIRAEIERALSYTTVYLRHKPLRPSYPLSNGINEKEQEAGAGGVMEGGEDSDMADVEDDSGEIIEEEL